MLGCNYRPQFIGGHRSQEISADCLGGLSSNPRSNSKPGHVTTTKLLGHWVGDLKSRLKLRVGLSM